MTTFLRRRRSPRPVPTRRPPARLRTILVPALLTLLSPPATGSLRAQVSQEEYAQRRAAVAGRMGEGALLAFGAPNFLDHDFRFRQLPGFDYLTGFKEPDAALIMLAAEGRVAGLTIFTETPTVRTQLYDGFREDPSSLARKMGARVRPLAELRPTVDSLVAAGEPLFELRDVRTGDYAARDTLTRGRAFLDDLRERHGGAGNVPDLHDVVNALRARKSDAEVGLLRRAIAITDEAHAAALGAVRPGAWEYQVEATIEAAFRGRGADGPAFSSIVGSGPNATTLHYVENDRRMEAGDLVVMDIGAEVEGYDADVTRTVPVSGRFTPEQRAVYDLVLDAQKAAEGEVRPGSPASASLDATLKIRLDGLARLGLVESPEASYDPPWPVDCASAPTQCLQGMLFMIHGISHGIGLEVHDPAQFYSGDRSYGVGDVFTIEPGIYIDARVLDLLADTPKNRAFLSAVRPAVERYDQIGVRIEDDYLVTDSGVERLSGAPREPEEIEAAMARARGGG